MKRISFLVLVALLFTVVGWFTFEGVTFADRPDLTDPQNLQFADRPDLTDPQNLQLADRPDLTDPQNFAFV